MFELSSEIFFFGRVTRFAQEPLGLCGRASAGLDRLSCRMTEMLGCKLRETRTVNINEISLEPQRQAAKGFGDHS